MSSGIRILWYNWKDIRNPEAGGAEVFTHEVAKRLIVKGHTVTLFTSSFRGAQNMDVVDGVKIVRRGSRTNVHRYGRSFYEEHKADFDIVVDEVNTKPFMTPSYVEKPKIALIHQLAREYWLYELFFPANLIGYYFLERYWLSKYVNLPTITVSQSTKRDLEAFGFNQVSVVSEGLSYLPLSEYPAKYDSPTVVYLGRLIRAKRIDHLLKSFRIVASTHPEAKLLIAGDGYLSRKLRESAGNGVSLCGKLPNHDVSRLLSGAWLLVNPSIREGFGLSIIEANAHATPAIGYDVAGVRDAIQNGKNGLLVPDGDIAKLADAMSLLLDDADLRLRMSKNALEYSRGFSWDKTADDFEKIICTVRK